jgi:hypothetical protein
VNSKNFLNYFVAKSKISPSVEVLDYRGLAECNEFEVRACPSRAEGAARPVDLPDLQMARKRPVAAGCDLGVITPWDRGHGGYEGDLVSVRDVLLKIYIYIYIFI